MVGLRLFGRLKEVERWKTAKQVRSTHQRSERKKQATTAAGNAGNARCRNLDAGDLSL